VTDGVGGSGNLSQVVAEVGIGKDAGFYLRGENRAGNGCFQPAISRETGSGNRRALGSDFARGLKLPVIVKGSARLRDEDEGQGDKSEGNEDVQFHVSPARVGSDPREFNFQVQ